MGPNAILYLAFVGSKPRQPKHRHCIASKALLMRPSPTRFNGSAKHTAIMLNGLHRYLGFLIIIEAQTLPLSKGTTHEMHTTKTAVSVFAILYTAVFFNTLLIHYVFTRPFRQFHGPVLRASDKNERVQTAAGYEIVEPTSVRDKIAEAAGAELGVTDGGTISSILRGEIAFPDVIGNDARRLRFEPGTLDLPQHTVLRHCYADPTIYKMHYPSSDRQVTSVSGDYKLVYLMIPKSGSSTGRWVMDNVLGAKDVGINPMESDLSTTYRDYTVVTFVRDPLSRFYSQYDEVFIRYAPWMKRQAGRAWKGMQRFEHPYPYLYENMTEWEDYQNAFCPPDGIPDEVDHRKQWCAMQQTQDNGTLAARFERFVQDYDGLTPWDIHLHLQVPHISNKRTGRPRRVNEIYNTATAVRDWECIVDWYGNSLPEDGTMNARSAPRRFDTTLVSNETKHRICKMSALDYCCLNMKLPPECSDEDVGVYCSLDRNRRGAVRIQPWHHPHEIS